MKLVIKILRGVLAAVLCLVLALNVWMLYQHMVLKKEAPEVFGYSQYIVTSGSMEPNISAGDLILIKPEEHYKLGDVVTFSSGGAVVTHRLMGTVEGQYITQGDANNAEDSELLSPEDILGKVQLVVPGAGYVVEFFRTPVGIAVLLAVSVLLIKLPDWAGALKTRAEGKHAQ